MVGAGFIGPVHVEGLRRAGVSVTGILDITPEKSRQAADRLGLEQAYETFEQVIDDRQVQAVHITTPNRYHFTMASAALRAGKHVMCEKPLAMDSRESAELVRLARDSGLAAGVNYNIRFYPLCQEAASGCAMASSGDVFHVTGSYVQDWLFHPTDFNWRVWPTREVNCGPWPISARIGSTSMHMISGLDVEAVLCGPENGPSRSACGRGGKWRHSAARSGSRGDGADAVGHRGLRQHPVAIPRRCSRHDSSYRR